ncbi:MAG: cytochrome c biogenesis protein/redoxin, partial [Angelakisella sp.]
KFFNGNRAMFARLGGIAVIMFGIYQLGILGSSRLMQQEHRLPLRLQGLAMNPLVALLMGFTFSFAWTPCVGPALTAVLLMASSAQHATQGYLLIGVYTLGFVLPFLAVGIFTGELLGLFRKHKKLLNYTVKAGGVLMIVMGTMMFTGWMNGITGYLSRFGTESASTPPSSASEALPVPTPAPTPDESQKIITPAPDFTLYDQLGNSHTLSEYKGKVVFLNFWATWCGYCVKEMPEIQTLYRQYNTPDSEVVILGVASPK